MLLDESCLIRIEKVPSELPILHHLECSEKRRKRTEPALLYLKTNLQPFDILSIAQIQNGDALSAIGWQFVGQFQSDGRLLVSHRMDRLETHLVDGFVRRRCRQIENHPVEDRRVDAERSRVLAEHLLPNDLRIDRGLEIHVVLVEQPIRRRHQRDVVGAESDLTTGRTCNLLFGSARVCRIETISPRLSVIASGRVYVKSWIMGCISVV